MDRIFAVFISSGSSSLSVTVVSSATDERAKGALFTGTRSEFEAYAQRVASVPPEARPAIAECFDQCADKPEGFTIRGSFVRVVGTHVPHRHVGHHRPHPQGDGSL